LQHLIHFGMLVFMFVSGTEINLRFLHNNRHSVVLTSVMGIVIPFGLGVSLALLAPEFSQGANQSRPWIFALVLGTALSISALPVILRILKDLHLLKSNIGLTIMLSAMINDLLGWIIFTLVIDFVQSTGTLISSLTSLGMVMMFAAVIFYLGPLLGNFLFNNETFAVTPKMEIAMCLLAVILLSNMAEIVGMHAFFAVFLLGIVWAPFFEGKHQNSGALLHHLALNIFAPLYFVSIGLKANFFSNFIPFFVITITVLACCGKILGAGLGALLGGMKPQEALCIGIGMNARGAMEIVLASLALEHGLITEAVYVSLVVMALATSLITGPILKRVMLHTEQPPIVTFNG
ncbi:cation:proton antiporter, partial [Heliobacterium undosum]